MEGTKLIQQTIKELGASDNVVDASLKCTNAMSRVIFKICAKFEEPRSVKEMERFAEYMLSYGDVIEEVENGGQDSRTII